MAGTPDLPIPISLISQQYFVFSIDAVSYLRREHHICGVLIGTLPQIPQQNVFLGLPLELLPEEARLLVEKKVAYIVDDAKIHQNGLKGLLEQDRRSYLQGLEQQGRQASLAQAGKKEQRREEALKKLDQKKAKKTSSSENTSSPQPGVDAAEDILFDAPEKSQGSSSRASIAIDAAHGVTPATSQGLFNYSPSLSAPLPEVPSSYPLFAHLHSKGYFLSPGLRFGCQYMAYPGDPLRFHSHFLVVSTEWDEEIDLMDLVVGGRLGTGVKKGFLIGGQEKVDDAEDGEASTAPVRTFSFEWAGM
ncbi:tRNA-intron endonuclease [Polytolypa hystricis UAMH7299]|uniref:tRNA-splicing endonuclease subunit Sen34 n=1 Tax=Polytolypa hystricis (strain UAMH7299) TaxID=1447883 RepID=A0A2B7YDG2_POLH7|nr:tRNA-intron endonuclease [Polytolypa hystricis UAMH7299]